MNRGLKALPGPLVPKVRPEPPGLSALKVRKVSSAPLVQLDRKVRWD